MSRRDAESAETERSGGSRRPDSQHDSEESNARAGPVDSLHRAAGNQAVQRSPGVGHGRSGGGDGLDGPRERGVRPMGPTDARDGSTPEPTADLCPRCLRRYRAGEPLDCEECERALAAGGGGRPPPRSVGGDPVRPKLEVGAPTDRYEREAERVAERVLRMDEPAAAAATSANGRRSTPVRVRRLCSGCRDRFERAEPLDCAECSVPVRRSDRSGGVPTIDEGLERQIESLRGGGRQLSTSTRSFFEPRFGRDFGDVRVHTGPRADRLARSIRAEAFTVGRDIVFASGNYRPGTAAGRELLAHELTHVVQNRTAPGVSRSTVRRQGSDLSSPRFEDDPTLESVLDGDELLSIGDEGRAVGRVQHALRDAGYFLSTHGVDEKYGPETASAVRQFQADHGLSEDGIVGPETMRALDNAYPDPWWIESYLALFGGVPWSESCVERLLCVWSEGAVTKLQNYTVKKYDEIYWEDEKYNGSKWVVDKFKGGGYHSTSRKEIGMLKDNSCEQAAGTLYHEAFHAAQPSDLTTRQSETRAYRYTEAWRIGLGLSGRSKFRTKDSSTGRTEVDVGAVESFVESKYPGPTPTRGEEIIDREPGPQGKTIIQRPGGSTYKRPPKKGDRVPGPMKTRGEEDVDTGSWSC